MRIDQVLHTNLFASVSDLHQRHAAAISAAVSSLVHGAFLTVTALGRGLQSPARTKHNIKRMDRLLANKAIQNGRLALYRALCHRLCRQPSQPIILVDWSDIVEQQRLLLIRAALVAEGRAWPRTRTSTSQSTSENDT